ncbi:MAG: hypothetical protein JNM19_14200, partial [Chitinophagaceae bacterium]|nr:hypothetical protein [Chitinophagaceae bacterium]
MLAGIAIILFATACTKKNTDGPVPVAEQIKGDTATVSLYIKKANSFLQTNYDSLYYYMDRARAISVALNYAQGVAMARAMESNYLRRKGDYSGAITLGLQVVHMYDSLRMWKELVRLKNVIADIYKEMGGEKGTMEYLEKGIEISKQAQVVAERERYPFGVIISLNQQAITLRDMSKESGRNDLMDSAFHLFQRGLQLINETKEGEEELGKFYNNICQVYNEHYKDYPKALEYVNKAVEFNTKRNNQLSLTYNYANLSHIYLNMGNTDKANMYAHMMLALSRQLASPFRMVNAYNALARINKTMGRYDSALYYKEMNTYLGDSLNNVKRAGLIAES